MALDVYFTNDIERDLISSVAMFLVGQMTSAQPDITACETIVAFAIPHAAKYGISHATLIDSVREMLTSIGKADVVNELIAARIISY